MPTNRAREEWARRTKAEYGSAGLAAQAAHWLIQAGSDEGLVHTALRIAADELAHARLSHAVLVSIGGNGGPLHFLPADAAHPANGTLLARLTGTVVQNFCLGESFAVPLFREMRSRCDHPEALEALDRILRDEPVHRKFGWDALDELLRIDAAGVRELVEHALPGWLEGYRRAYGAANHLTPISRNERQVGMLDGTDYVEQYLWTVENWIQPGMTSRGIPCPKGA